MRSTEQLRIILDVVEVNLFLKIRRVGQKLGEAEDGQPIRFAGQLRQLGDQIGVVGADDHLPRMLAIRG